jgi:cell division septation protein DedD
MMPRLETSESYALRQVAAATKLAEKRAKWFYQQGNTDDPIIKPLDHPKSEKLLDDLKRISKARRDNRTDKSVRERNNTVMEQYTKSLIPILIKRMVDAASADKAEAPAPAPKEHEPSPAPTPATTSKNEAEATASPAPTPATTSMNEAEAAAYALELSARAAGSTQGPQQLPGIPQAMKKLPDAGGTKA